MTAAERADLRCSMQARAGEVRPVGTAVAVDAFALLELPLPWPSHIEEHASLAGVAEVLAPIGARLQGVVPSAAATSSGQYRATLYVRPDGPFRRYLRVERTGALIDLAETCQALRRDAEALVAGPAVGERGSTATHAVGSAAVGGDGEAVGGDGLTAGREGYAGDTSTGEHDESAGADGGSGAPPRELLVCTHGSRDRCCGSMGTVAFASIDLRPDVRLGRTSHLGGHRFAPTAALLPEGTVWAWLDGPTLAAVLDRSVPVSAVIDQYRGSTAMAEPTVQAAEAAVFAEVGWTWLDEHRSGEVVESGDDRWVVRIDSSAGSWTAEVVNHGDVPQPTCGTDEPSTKTDPQLEVVSITRAP